MRAPTTFLAAGQRWIKTDCPSWRADLQITILQVSRGSGQTPRVTYRCPNGDEVRGPAASFEAAVAAGRIVPVSGAGLPGRC